ncbi:phosphoglycerate mutase family protein [Adhaeribacter soli]|nr:phosphoglycerate mutase family protein [Adhaeribacter soli]
MLQFLILLLNVLFLSACSQKIADPVPLRVTPAPAPQKSTTIYLLRHAEKANSSADPDLSAAGQERAIALRDSLSKLPVNAIYSTPYKRTRQTVAPLAAAKNIQEQEYDANNLTALTTKILKDNLSQTVVIVGHANTVLETMEAFKAKRPIAALTESDYNYLFKLTLAENKDPQVEVKRYGN